jgi:hypothetical protein
MQVGDRVRDKEWPRSGWVLDIVGDSVFVQWDGGYCSRVLQRRVEVYEMTEG